MKLTLKKPIVVGEKNPITITELNFREDMCAGDLRGLRASSLSDPKMEDLLLIAGRLCAQPDPVMQKLGLEDFGEVVSLVQGFINAGQETGTTSSPS